MRWVESMRLDFDDNLDRWSSRRLAATPRKQLIERLLRGRWTEAAKAVRHKPVPPTPRLKGAKWQPRLPGGRPRRALDLVIRLQGARR
jgi:hypothetical protein